MADRTPPSARGDRSAGEGTAGRYVDALGDVGAIERSGVFAGPYRRLFTAQVLSSYGDWIGFLAVTYLAAKAAGTSNAGYAISAVLSARLLPGFFFGAVATALLDRWDRKKIMVACDVGRGLLIGIVPFVHTVWALFVLSVALELLTLMWTPAKEASVPNLVRPEQLAAANSASLGAAYGTILPAVLTFPAFTVAAGTLAHLHPLGFLHLSQQSLAVYVDVCTFLVSALLISGLPLPRKTAEQKAAVAAVTPSSTWRDAKEGWRYIGTTYRVRAVIIGFCTGVIGGGIMVPLAVTFAASILHRGPTAFALLELALGLGVAVGVVLVALTQRHFDHDQVFVSAVAGAGAALLFAASMAHLGLVMLGIGLLGVCAGAVYVLGFTILGSTTTDEFRGRIFGVFYTLVRLCLLLSFVLAPLLSGLLDHLSSHLRRRAGAGWRTSQVGTSSWHVALPGSRLTLWLGGLVILLAAWFARRDLRRAVREGQHLPVTLPDTVVDVRDADTPLGPMTPGPASAG